MFQPNAAPWQQQQHQQHPQQQPQQQTQMQQPQQQQQQQVGLSVPTDQNYAFNSTNSTNQQYFNNFVSYQKPVNAPNQLVEQVQQPPTLDMAAFQATQPPPPIQETPHFFDNNQNNNVKNDGWGDWGDWNDNLSNAENHTNNNNQPTTFFNPAVTQQQQQQQQQNNIINDSFTANDKNWNWNMNISSEQQPITTTPIQQQKQQLQPVSPIENTTNNIPNSVYVSQAKPVSMPSRQFALTPSEISTAVATAAGATVEQVFAPPPEGFQNDAQAAPPPPLAVTAPPPPMATAAGNMAASNPFKRTAAIQHHVASYIPTATTVGVQNIPTKMPTTLPFVAPEVNNIAANVSVSFEQPENAEVLHENQEIPPQQQQQQQTHINDERNQYLQTSHLSENANDDNNIEADNLPPPGLSRLVLGQPGFDVAQQRLVPGKEVWPNNSVGSLSLNERHADGEDNVNDNNNVATTIRNTSTGVPTATTDRNLYLVPGQSNGNTDQLPRVLTGFDVEQTTNMPQQQQPMVSQQPQQQQQLQQQQVQAPQQPQQQSHINVVEQRDVELDGENVEDQQQQQQQIIVMQPPQQQTLQPQQQRNEPPLEGAAAQTEPQTKLPTNTALDGKEFQQPANVGKDEQLTHEQQLQQQQQQFSKKKEKKRNSVDRYNSDEDSEEADYSSDRERERERQRHRRNYREGSVRSDAGHERDWEDSDVHRKERRRRDRHEKESGEKEKPHDKYYRGGGNDTLERRSKRYTRYDQDSSHEENGRKDKTLNKRSTRDRDNRERERGERERVRERDRRHEREHDEFNRRYRNSKRVVDEDNSARMRRERERDYDDKQERRQRRSAVEKHRTVDERERDREEYEDYRKHSSRNARESDAEKERGGRAYDPRYAAMYGYHHTGQTSSAYGAYDPYAYYYDHLARFNPQAYSEMYKKYYGAHSTASAGDVSAVGNVSSTAATGAGSDHLTGDGRESVHSGRSSLQHDRER